MAHRPLISYISSAPLIMEPADPSFIKNKEEQVVRETVLDTEQAKKKDSDDGEPSRVMIDPSPR